MCVGGWGCQRNNDLSRPIINNHQEDPRKNWDVSNGRFYLLGVRIEEKCRACLSVRVISIIIIIIIIVIVEVTCITFKYQNLEQSSVGHKKHIIIPTSGLESSSDDQLMPRKTTLN